MYNHNTYSYGTINGYMCILESTCVVTLYDIVVQCREL